MPDYEEEHRLDASRLSLRAFLMRDWPYFAMLILALFGVAYTSISRQAMTTYWIVLAPCFAIICIIARWPDISGKELRWSLIKTEALHWLAVIVSMYLVFVSDVKQTMSSDASALMLLTLLALGTFTAGLHVAPGAYAWLGSYWLLRSPQLLGSNKQLCFCFWQP